MKTETRQLHKLKNLIAKEPGLLRTTWNIGPTAISNRGIRLGDSDVVRLYGRYRSLKRACEYIWQLTTRRYFDCVLSDDQHSRSITIRPFVEELVRKKRKR